VSRLRASPQVASALAYGIAGAEADQGRRHRGRQQDRQDGLALMVKRERYKDPVALASGRGKGDHRNQNKCN
jgi:hypothetical protein